MSHDYEVVWPLGAARGESVAMSPRLAELEGTTIGFVWDYVFRGDEIFAQLQEALGERFPGMRFVPYATFGNIHGNDQRAVTEAIPDKLHAERVDAVIVGVGN